MKKICLFCVSLLTVLLFTVTGAAEEAAYCFSHGDFGNEITGICIQKIPEGGTLMLGSRCLRPGDVLTADQAGKMTYHSPSGQGGEVLYLPVDGSGVLETVSFLIPGREDQAPVAEDSALETYQNLPNMGTLRVRDPEQKELTITVTREPRRGTVEIGEKGTFTYTPKKNKVGTDSFTYTAKDPEGNVSREATVTLTILKPSESPRYRDTASLTCSFSAEWMKNTGIFAAENVGDTCCFQPDKPVEKGEFLTMLLKTLEIRPEPQLTAGLEHIPQWLRPYAAAAVRSGITAGLPADMDYGTPISSAEAAVMIRNALDLPAGVRSEEENVPVWASSAAAALRKQGISLQEGEFLTRGAVSELLYQVHLSRKSR